MMFEDVRNLFLLMVVIFFLGCEKTELPVIDDNEYDSGVFILNQGKFGDGTGTISYYDRDTTLKNDVYQNENLGNVLGNVVQSMIRIDDKIFVAVNNAAKLQVLDAQDMTMIAEIEGIDQPRYFAAPGNGFLYVSSWGADGVSGSITKIDISLHTIVNQLSIGGGPEKMVASDGTLLIAKSGGFGTDSTLAIYNLSQDVIVDNMIVGDNPTDIVSGSNGIQYILCSGAYDFVDPANNTLGSIYKLDRGELSLLTTIANGSNNLAIDIASDILYHLDGSGLQKLDPNAKLYTKIKEGFYYGLGFDSKENELYLADAKDFSSNGEAIVLGVDGEELKRLPTGIIPAFFYFID